MRFSFSCALALLATIISPLPASALPVRPRADAQPGLIHLPLKRLQQVRDNIHPQIFLQQHVNRGLRRLARMTGSAEPSPDQLKRNIEKRLYYLDHANGLHPRHQKGGLAGLLSGIAGGNAGTRGRKGGNGRGRGGRKGANRGGHGGGNNGGNNGNNTTTIDTATETATDTATETASETATDTTATDTATETASETATATETASETATETAPPAENTGFSNINLEAAINGGLTPANAPEDPNSLGLDIEANDIGYVATVTIGTPPRQFKLLMDSGSADMWVGSEDCQSSSQQGADCGNHQFLGPQSSSSFQQSQTEFSVTYGTGSVSGLVVADDVTFAAGQVLTGHIFGVANQESIEFTSADFDGLVGLAQSTLSQQQTLTPVEALAQQGLIADAITSYKISRLADQLNDGEITFGGLDAAKFNANSLVTVDNVNQQGFWEVDMDVTVDGQDIGLKGRTGIMDTGTTLIIAPQEDAEALHAAIPGARSDGSGGFIIPCTTTASIALTIGGSTFSINPVDLSFLPVDQDDLTGDCVSGISSGQIGGATEWLVGDVFLKNVYLSTDVTKNTVSFATLA